MKTEIVDGFLSDDDTARARQIIGSCVHCGMCLPVCPTYQLDADERDSPRGRIYLINKMLEDGAPSAVALRHLDRCLTCRACETACPSGVKYGELKDIGMHAAEPKRGKIQSLMHAAVAEWFANALPVKLMSISAGIFRPFLPGGFRKHLGRRRAPPPDVREFAEDNRTAATEPESDKPLRRVVVLQGCVEGALSPQTHAALKTVLAAGGCEVYTLPGCCGALRYHLNRRDAGKNDMKRNVETLAKMLRSGQIDAAVMTASGCHQMVSEYPRILKSEDAEYVTQRTLNAAEAVERLWPAILPKLKKAAGKEVVYHSPCTMQNGLRLGGRAEALLEEAGYQVNTPAQTACCGSAGSYSLLQRRRANALRKNKLQSMAEAGSSDSAYATANIGCQLHLCNGGDKPVLHWLELLADLLEPARS